ncbi:MAG: T9SS type A sorting domain-containing protein [Candidatus Cloacimonetes bacterium]|nr:T9SS type A sorting domain-containing protein [Candidatus Cloacimonadota bacterium]
MKKILFILISTILALPIPAFELNKISEFSFSEMYGYSNHGLMIQNNKLYTSNFRGLRIFDILNDTLVLNQEINMSHLQYDLDVKNSIVLLSAIPDNLFYHVDIQDPANPIISTPINYLGDHLFFIDGDYAYVNDRSTNNEWNIHVYNYETFEEITSFWTPHPGSGIRKFKDGVGSFTENSIRYLYDISDPFSLQLIGSGTTNQSMAYWRAEIIQDTLLFCGDNNSFHIYNISDLFNWEFLSESEGCHSFRVSDDNLIAISGINARLYDISNLYEPVLIDEIELNQLEEIRDLCVNDNIVYFVTGMGRLFVYDIGNDKFELIQCVYNEGYMYGGGYLYNDQLYISTMLDGINQWDLTDLYNPQQIESYFTDHYSVILRGDEDKMIQFCWNSEPLLQTDMAIQINTDGNLEGMARLTDEVFAGWMNFIDGVGYFNATFEVFNKYIINDDNEFEVVGNMDLPEGVLGGQIFFPNDQVAYLTPPHELLVINNINTNDQMELVNSYTTPTAGAETAAFFENLFFLSEEGDLCTCSIYDISNPLAPELLLQIPESGLIAVDEENELLFLGNYECTVYDLSSWETGIIPEIYSFTNWSECQEIIPFKRDCNDYLIYIESTSCSIYQYDYEQNPAVDDIISIKPHISNYPNPFNPETNISFNLTTEITEDIELTIYNIKGQRIRQFSIFNNQSSILWDGKDGNNKSVSSGIYMYQLKVDGKAIASKKCLLLK